MKTDGITDVHFHLIKSFKVSNLRFLKYNDVFRFEIQKNGKNSNFKRPLKFKF